MTVKVMTARTVATTVTSSGPALSGHQNPADATSGTVTLTLPTGKTDGASLSVVKIDSSGNAVVCSGSIRGVGSSSVTLAAQNQLVEFIADSSGSWWPDVSTVTAPASMIVRDFSWGGTLVVGAGTFKVYNDTGRTLTFAAIRAAVGVAPTGSSAIFDVHKGGTTIFGTQTARPTITAGTTTALAGTPTVTTWAPGEYLTVSQDQVGSTVAGSDLVLTVTAA